LVGKVGTALSPAADAASRFFSGKGAQATDYLVRNADKLNRTKTVMSNIGTRPYINSTLLIQQIMQSSSPMPDPYTASGLKWVVEGMHNGSSGIYELVINPDTMTIIHFLYKTTR
jgi:hypothetical protein